MPKRVIIADDGVMVEHVVEIPTGIDVPDDAYVGPGMLWNASAESPQFAQPAS